MSDFKRIVVKPGRPVKVVYNPTRYSLVGRGAHGAVFKLSKHRCVKIFPNPESARLERGALMAGQRSSVFPKLYGSGRNYVVMEYISGSSLYEHLKKIGFVSDQMTKEILFLLNELKRLRFARHDAALRHLRWTKTGKLRIIDHVNSLKRKYSRPVRLLRGLRQLGLQSSFLNRVRKQDPLLYRRWKRKMN